jgi:hypothetical protein
LIQAEDRFCELRELAAAPPPRPGKVKPMHPVYRGGRRWPSPSPAPDIIWRLSVSYWRIRTEAREPLAAAGEAPEARRRVTAVDAQALRARLSQPLRPVKPQQPLDIGLFEVRPPEAPHILMPDE